MPKKPRLCPKCSEKLKYNRKTKQWHCPACLLGAYLTDQAQKEAMKKYRQSEGGIQAAKKYEQSEKGQTARQRYLKSPKYKQRRKEYNERLKESLRIAREAGAAARGARPTPAETSRDLGIIKRDILEFKKMAGHLPSISDVQEWAEEYEMRLSEAEAQKLLQEA